MRIEVFPQTLEDVGGVLLRDQPEVELGGRLGREHRLRAGTLIAGGDAGDVAGGGEQQLFDHLLGLGITNEAVEPDQLLALLDLGVDLGHHATVGVGGLDQAVVEAVDPDVHVLIAKTCKRFDQVHRRRRIDRRKARVLVELEKLHPQLHVDKASAAELECGPARLVE